MAASRFLYLKFAPGNVCAGQPSLFSERKFFNLAKPHFKLFECLI